jgi:hypothetical protein
MPSPVPPETQGCSRLVIGEEWWGPGSFARLQSYLACARRVVSMPQLAGLIQAVYVQPVTRTRPILRDHQRLIESNIRSGRLETIPKVVS